MLERMCDFFDNRIKNYEQHQLFSIKHAQEFYDYTAKFLPKISDACILDLGCGTGLELDYYFKIVPSANITGIDLAPKMLDTLKKKFPDKSLKLILGSYFDVDFGENKFDAALSVESLHHFTQKQKTKLYIKLRKALKKNGYFILTDYFALSDKEEKFYCSELIRLKKEQNISDNEFYHYDTPLTVEHEKEALLNSGFSSVEILNNWEATYILRANI